MFCSFGYRIGLAVWFLIGFCLLKPSLHAQNPVERFIPSESMPVPYLTEICKLPDGRMAFMSYHGLILYDGYEYDYYGIAEGLPSLMILSHALDQKGRLWIYTSEGLACYHKGQIRSFPKINKTLRTLLHPRQIYPAKDTIYVEYSGHGKTLKIYHPPGQADNWSQMKMTEHGRILLRNTRHPEQVLMRLNILKNPDPKSDLILRAESHNVDLRFPRPENALYGSVRVFGTNALVYSFNDIYICNQKGILKHYHFDREIVQAKLFGNELWLCMDGYGLIHFSDFSNPATKKEYYSGIQKYGFWDIHQDGLGGYWLICADRTGQVHVSDFKLIELKTKQELTTTFLSKIITHQNELYLAHSMGEIGKLNRESLTEQPLFNEKLNRQGISNWISYHNKLYFSTRKGIFVAETNKQGLKITTLSDKEGHSFFVSRTNGELYAAINFEGALCLTDPRKSIQIVGNDGLKIESFDTEQNDTIFTSATGLWKWKNNQAIPHGKGLFFRQLIVRDYFSRGIQVFRSLGMGVLFIQGKDSVYINNKNGLNSNMISSVFEDHLGNFWLSGNGGINRISMNGSIKNYRVYPTVFADRDVDGFAECYGKLWAFNDTYLFVINQSEKVPRLPLRIIKIKANGELKDGVWQLKDNRMEINFRAVYYDLGINPIYEYRLKGKQKHWIKTRNQQINFENLNPGTYYFELRLSGQSRTLDPIIFKVPTPFYASWWFISLLILMVLGSTAYVFFTYLKRKRLEHAFLNSELKALRSQMNPHFTFNTLNSIQRFIMKSDPDAALEFVHDYALLVRMILNNSSEEIITIAREMEAIRLYLNIEQVRLDQKFTYAITLDDEIEPEFDKIPSMVIQPFLENAIWHGISNKIGKGQLNIHLHRQNEWLICTIVDDGVGREQAEKLKSRFQTERKSLGIEITKDRLKLMSGRNKNDIHIQLEDLYDDKQNACGTRVTLRIKINGL